MVVIAARQTGARPETIRTRLARFMPSPAAAGWSVAWSANSEHADEIANQDEQSVAEHLGCYGAAVAHVLAQAEVMPVRMRVTAEAQPSIGDIPQPIALEVRAEIAGAALDPIIFESIVRRAQPTCPVWNTLASQGRVQVIALLDDSTTAEPAADKKTPTSPRLRAPSFNAIALPRPTLPTWIKPRTAIMLAVALGLFAVMPHPWA